MNRKGFTIPKPNTSLGECIEEELHGFIYNCYTGFRNQSSLSPVLCFPPAKSVAVCKYIRYYALLYGLVSVYLGPKENMRMCIFHKLCLKPYYRKHFHKFFSTEDEDKEPVLVSHLNCKLEDASKSKLRKQSKQLNGKNKETQHNYDTAEGDMPSYTSAPYSVFNPNDYVFPTYPMNIENQQYFPYYDSQNQFDSQYYNVEPQQHSEKDETLCIPYQPYETEYGAYMYPQTAPNQHMNKSTSNYSYPTATDTDWNQINPVTKRVHHKTGDYEITKVAELEDAAMGEPISTIENAHFDKMLQLSPFIICADSDSDIDELELECNSESRTDTTNTAQNHMQQQARGTVVEDLNVNYYMYTPYDTNELMDTTAEEFDSLTLDSNMYAAEFLNKIGQGDDKIFQEEISRDIYCALNSSGFPLVNRKNAPNIDEEYIMWIQEYIYNPLIVCSVFNYESLLDNFVENENLIIELYDFPRSTKTFDLLSMYREEPRYIKWCDDLHALLISSTTNQVKRALAIKHPLAKSRIITEGGTIATIFACRIHLHSLVKVQNNEFRLQSVATNDVEQDLVLFNSLISIRKNMEASKLRILVLTNCNITKIEHLDGLTNLTELNLEFNKIKVIEGLSDHFNLQMLKLNNNLIEKIENLETVPKLTALNLNYNKLTKIENLKRVSVLRILDLKGNQITTIENLDGLPHLLKLMLSDNFITALDGLNFNNYLEYLDLNCNKITVVNDVSGLLKLNTVLLCNNQIDDWLELKNLVELPMIKKIDRRGNPLTKNVIFYKTLNDDNVFQSNKSS